MTHVLQGFNVSEPWRITASTGVFEPWTDFWSQETRTGALLWRARKAFCLSEPGKYRTPWPEMCLMYLNNILHISNVTTCVTTYPRYPEVTRSNRWPRCEEDPSLGYSTASPGLCDVGAPSNEFERSPSCTAAVRLWHSWQRAGANGNRWKPMEITKSRWIESVSQDVFFFFFVDCAHGTRKPAGVVVVYWVLMTFAFNANSLTS